MAWIDQHCHLAPATATEQVDQATAEGVRAMITVGTTLDRSIEAIAVAEMFPNVWATAGVHPHDATDGIAGLKELLANDQVVAVGECGLDYHYNHSPAASQADVFVAQIELAHEFDLPLVIHTREAWDDTFAILDAHTIPRRTVFHCFTGGPGEAEKCLERGALISFSGIVTFANADDVRAAAALCPLARVVVETDSPYLSPVPFRGQTNVPGRVPFVGAAVAAAMSLEPAEVEAATYSNTRQFYDLDLPDESSDAV